MVFSSATFIFVFLPVTFVINFFLKGKVSNIWLLIASLIFYAWGEPEYVVLLLISLLVNWMVGRTIDSVEGKERKIALILGIIFNLGILAVYKYAGFGASFVNMIFGKNIVPNPGIVLPIGISFYTFQAISYIVDVYRKDTEASKSFINVALYISFFPQLIAGPIVKYRDINKQIEKRTVTWIKVAEGFKRFIYGLSKKILISNVLGECVDAVYSLNIANIDSKAAWIGALAYTFQIYYDFSGYSDMAIGLGKMFGFDILENFNYPYLSKSISEFWRRWHISLGTWFKEYLYIPLGGNRKGKVRTYWNLVIVFFLTGLWHGADWSFVLWGLYHGLFSIIERLGVKRILDKTKVVSRILCFAIVNFGWVLFRAPHTSSAIRYLARMVIPWKYANINCPSWQYMDGKTIFIGICAVAGMGILKTFIPEKICGKWKDSVIEAIYCVMLLFLCLAAIASNTYNPFIYFQF